MNTVILLLKTINCFTAASNRATAVCVDLQVKHVLFLAHEQLSTVSIAMTIWSCVGDIQLEIQTFTRVMTFESTSI